MLDAAKPVPLNLATDGEENDTRSYGSINDPAYRTVVDKNPALSYLTQAKRIITLQGPIGPFFDRLSSALPNTGAQIWRVLFNGGDDQQTKLGHKIAFRGSVDEWPAAFLALVENHKIDCVLLFGQYRIYHQLALKVCTDKNIPVIICEEGYFRPGYVTLEIGGVNVDSTTLEKYIQNAGAPPIQPIVTRNHFFKMVLHACQYYLNTCWHKNKFPHYVHHRHLDLIKYSVFWINSWLRKHWRSKRDFDRQLELLRDHSKAYFFVPLQLDIDSQVTVHGPVGGVTVFIEDVLSSFAKHAPQNVRLVFKQHPHARADRKHEHRIFKISKELGISDRVELLIEGDTPLLAEHARGVVVINSTVGLQTLERGSPLKVIGRAMYSHLSQQVPLDEFWKSPISQDPQAVNRYLFQLKCLTQIGAELYGNRSEPLSLK
jgi:capsular polysaccharide export protein